jgi:ESS family glutamate:Na+ symporter
MEQNLVELDSFVAYTIGIIVYFVGLRMTGRIEFLRSYNIPEPVTGGILASLVALLVFVVFDIEVEYDLHIRDVLLVYFFTTIGINARISDLVAGGKPLLILLLLTLVYIVLQDVVGVATAVAIGQPAAVGVITGSASLIGGHGTSIAWAPEIAANHGVPNALEMGIASATLGLVIASLLGGPIAKYLLRKHDLSGDSSEDNVVGIPHENENTETINHTSIMRVILVIHIAIIIGYGLNEVISEIGIKLPLFVSCLLVAIFMSNLAPLILPKLIWPSRTKALALVSDFSLGLFIAMSLMGMQLWAIADLAGPLLLLLTLQAVVAVVFTVFILFRLMGGDYQAAVLSAGFAGFSLGATPTAIANMTAVTKTHGPAPTAFIILPLVGAFFVDIANSFIIQFFLGL